MLTPTLLFVTGAETGAGAGVGGGGGGGAAAIADHEAGPDGAVTGCCIDGTTGDEAAGDLFEEEAATEESGGFLGCPPTGVEGPGGAVTGLLDTAFMLAIRRASNSRSGSSASWYSSSSESSSSSSCCVPLLPVLPIGFAVSEEEEVETQACLTCADMCTTLTGTCSWSLPF